MEPGEIPPRRPRQARARVLNNMGAYYLPKGSKRRDIKGSVRDFVENMPSAKGMVGVPGQMNGFVRTTAGEKINAKEKKGLAALVIESANKEGVARKLIRKTNRDAYKFERDVMASVKKGL